MPRETTTRSWVEQYLQLPEGSPGRDRRVERVHRGAGYRHARQSTPYDAAKAIEGYLRGFPVAFDVPDTPPGRDTVDYFLFDSQRGYFDYHASAMVVMLRTLGIPARMGVGFVVDEGDLNREGKAYVVRDRNTYAWPEVFFPGEGWVVFNPTQDRPADLRPRVEQPVEGLEGIDPDILENLPVGADPIFDIPGEAFGGCKHAGGGPAFQQQATALFLRSDWPPSLQCSRGLCSWAGSVPCEAFPTRRPTGRS